MPKTSLIVQDLNNLHLYIHTIGYPNEGESLLTLLCDGDKVLFSVLTDCYEYNGYNHAAQILKGFNVNQIDAFIWTSPSKDHSVGIPNFLDEFDSDHTAKIFLPNGLYLLDLKQKAKEALNYIYKHYISNRQYNVNYIQAPSKQFPPIPDLNLRIEVMKPRVTIKCCHIFLLPNDYVIDRISASDTGTLLNDLSIVYYINFNNFSFFFCGGLSERNVQFINPFFLNNSVFITIPHHGSDILNKKLVRLLSIQNVKHAISTTTAFKCNNIPWDEALNKYQTISGGVYCTRKIHEEQIAPFGCITTKFYANMKEPEIITTGNAYCYYSTKHKKDFFS